MFRIIITTHNEKDCLLRISSTCLSILLNDSFVPFVSSSDMMSHRLRPVDGSASKQELEQLLHGPSMFAVKAKIYGVLCKQSSAIAFDETSSKTLNNYCTARQCSRLRRKFMECSINNPALSLLMKHLVTGQRQKALNFSAFHWSPHGSLVSIGQHFVTTRVVHLPKRTETS